MADLSISDLFEQVNSCSSKEQVFSFLDSLEEKDLISSAEKGALQKEYSSVVSLKVSVCQTLVYEFNKKKISPCEIDFDMKHKWANSAISLPAPSPEINLAPKVSNRFYGYHISSWLFQTLTHEMYQAFGYDISCDFRRDLDFLLDNGKYIKANLILFTLVYDLVLSWVLFVCGNK